jgi:uncharacterized cofD-like protein
MDNTKHLVCLGGGIGTVNLLQGLKQYTTNITTIISMADNGGSSGRLRRLYNVLPSGDLVSCMAAMTNHDDFTKKLLTFRFPGERYGDDHELGGQKLGNLIMVALEELTNDYQKAITKFQELFDVQGKFIPATKANVDISATTVEGKEIFGEETIDLGKYEGKRILESIKLHPQDAIAPKEAVTSLREADTIICGPGDLYTNMLPVIIVPEIKQALIESKAKKILIINVANKPFETLGYDLQDYIDAVKRHIGCFPFNFVIVNNNFSIKIPKKYHYTYVSYKNHQQPDITLIERDLVNQDFPLYHDSDKLAKVVWENI